MQRCPLYSTMRAMQLSAQIAGVSNMMTKWDTIQADIADAYRHWDEREAVAKDDDDDILDDFDADVISIDELAEQELTLDWTE